MNVRRATARDFLAIAALDRVAWGQLGHADFIPDGEHAWRIWCEHAQVFCAEDADGAVRGAILAFACEDGRYCLHKVFVDEHLRGHGVGTRLFAALLEQLDDIGAACFLTVDPANAAALALYAKWGFSEKTFVKGYYRDAEDRFVLTRPSTT